MEYTVLVIDVESLGLHGPAFMVAGQLVRITRDDTVVLHSFRWRVEPETLRDHAPPEALKWVRENVPDLPATHNSPYALQESFWNLWTELRAKYPGLVMAADTAWPVEARFLNACVDVNRPDREWTGPYPLWDVSTLFAALGFSREVLDHRQPCELPAHDPLNDVRQSVRLLALALREIDRLRRHREELYELACGIRDGEDVSWPARRAELEARTFNADLVDSLAARPSPYHPDRHEMRRIEILPQWCAATSRVYFVDPERPPESWPPPEGSVPHLDVVPPDARTPVSTGA